MVCACLCLSLTHKTRWRMVRTNKVSPHTKPRLPLVDGSAFLVLQLQLSPPLPRAVQTPT